MCSGTMRMVWYGAAPLLREKETNTCELAASAVLAASAALAASAVLAASAALAAFAVVAAAGLVLLVTCLL